MTLNVFPRLSSEALARSKPKLNKMNNISMKKIAHLDRIFL